MSSPVLVNRGAETRPWRWLALVAAAVSIFFAVRDAFGFTDAYPVTNATYDLHDHVWGFVRLLMTAVAGLIAFRGEETRRTRTLAGALIGLSLNNNWWFYAADDPWLWLSAVVNYVGIAFGLTESIRFAASFTNGDRWAVRRGATAIAPFLGMAVAVFGLCWWFSAIVDQNPRPVLNTLFWVGWDTATVAIIATSLVGVFTAVPAERVTASCVLGSFAVAAFGTMIHGIDRLVQGDTSWANDVDAIAQLALPVGLVYAVLRRQVLDVRFVSIRSALFGLLTITVGGAFSVIEKYVDHAVVSAHLVRGPSEGGAKVVELGLSLVVAGSFKGLDRLLERVMVRFRGAADKMVPPSDDSARSAIARVAQLELRIAELEAARTMAPTDDKRPGDKST